MKRLTLTGITILSTILLGSSAAASGTLTVAMHPNLKPFVFYDKEGNLCGIDVDLAQLIAEEEEFQLEILEVELDEIFDAVSEGEADMGISALTVTEERAEIIDFTDDYMLTKQRILVCKDSEIQNKEDLGSRIVGVMEGSVAEKYLAEDETILIRYLKGYSSIDSYLVKGYVDAVIMDEEACKAAMEESQFITMLEDEFEQEHYAIILPKGDTETLNEINQIIAVLKETGELRMIMEKYITEETEWIQ